MTKEGAILDDSDADKARTEKWFWKMDYCKKHGLAPAQNAVWDYVETKWLEAHLPFKDSLSGISP